MTELVLGIESSCDETACALLENGKILSSKVYSQVAQHAPYGGVVPELAGRRHLESLFPLLDACLEEADKAISDVSLIAVTKAPGLIGPLLVGLSAAKAIAYAQSIPLIGVNHLQAHLLAARLMEDAPNYPFLGLIVSGGHTALYVVRSATQFDLLGKTRDDAAGEAFDKVAKMLDLGYPGGPAIAKVAAKSDPEAFAFPRALRGKNTLDFSFSGLKTAVRLAIDAADVCQVKADLCASFQEAVADALIIKTRQALKKTRLKRWVLAGGVAANERLRVMAKSMSDKEGVELYLPSIDFCTDNAAMVAIAGLERYQAGERADLTLNAAAVENLF